MRAALLRNTGDETLDVVDDMQTIDPGPGQVKVKIGATGVCHSDLSAMNGTIPQPAPAVLGHEGAGVVVALGDGVTTVAEGDHVIVAWSPPCGTCPSCTGRHQPHLCFNVQMMMAVTPNFILDGNPAFGMAGTGTFAEEVVLPKEAVIKIDADVPLEIASAQPSARYRSLIGCGVMTGVGAAINTAKVSPGSSVLVFGCGGVGISVIQGARIAGAAEIVAVDLNEDKHATAKAFGATHACTPDQLPDVKAEITGGEGFDYAFEAIGLAATMRGAYDNTRRGGTTVIVGVGRAEQQVSFNAFELFFDEKTLTGSYYGSADVRTDFARMIRLWKAGRLDLESMISRKITLDDINDALGALARGEVIRQVITF